MMYCNDTNISCYILLYILFIKFTPIMLHTFQNNKYILFRLNI